MDFNDTLQRAMQYRHNQGISDQEISKNTGVAQSYISNLRNGRRKFIVPDTNGKPRKGGISLKLFLELFPEVREVLEEHFCKGEGASTKIGHAVNGNSNHVEGNITTNVSSPADARLDAALDAVLADAEICDKCRLAVVRHIRAAAHS